MSRRVLKRNIKADHRAESVWEAEERKCPAFLKNTWSEGAGPCLSLGGCVPRMSVDLESRMKPHGEKEAGLQSSFLPSLLTLALSRSSVEVKSVCGGAR